MLAMYASSEPTDVAGRRLVSKGRACEARVVESCGKPFCKASKSDKNRIGRLLVQLNRRQPWAGFSIFQSPN